MGNQRDIPLYHKIREHLRMAILSGQMPPDAPIPGEIELARQYGVSRNTTRQAIMDLTREGILQRTPHRGTFIVEGCNRACNSNQVIRNRQIGFITSVLNDYFGSELTAAIDRASRELGYSLLVRVTERSYEVERQVINDMVNQGAAGIISFPTVPPESNVYRELLSTGFPLVMVDCYLLDLDTAYVVSDNFGGAFKAVEHLVRLGHRRISYIGGGISNVSSSIERYNGFRQALLVNDCPIPPCLLDLDIAKSGIDQVLSDVMIEKRIAEFLEESKPTAVFAQTDATAMVVMKAAKRCKIRIPNDVAIVGFDDMAVSAHLPCPLTTVRQDTAILGNTAVNLLHAMLTGKQLSGAEKVHVPVELVVRESCGVHLHKRCKQVEAG